MAQFALQRILIKTHHMTSRKKISVITKAAKNLNCTVILKTGSPPGIMLCEGIESNAREWETIVRKLRYKDMRLLKRESIERKFFVALGVGEGDVMEIEEIKELGRFLEGDGEVYRWWRVGMGYLKEDDGN